jgi:hypothetical protein
MDNDTLLHKLDQILSDRGHKYGNFEKNAEIAQKFKEILRDSPNWEKMTHRQREALEMIVHKMARILNGDPDYSDSWEDIAGYVFCTLRAINPN